MEQLENTYSCILKVTGQFQFRVALKFQPKLATKIG